MTFPFVMEIPAKPVNQRLVMICFLIIAVAVMLMIMDLSDDLMRLWKAEARNEEYGYRLHKRIQAVEQKIAPTVDETAGAEDIPGLETEG